MSFGAAADDDIAVVVEYKTLVVEVHVVVAESREERKQSEVRDFEKRALANMNQAEKQETRKAKKLSKKATENSSFIAKFVVPLLRHSTSHRWLTIVACRSRIQAQKLQPWKAGALLAQK